MDRTLYFVVLDGLSDEAVPDLGGRTPLAAAHTPQLDRMAWEGALGTCTTVGDGIAPESDIAVMALLGYDPSVHHPGRGPVEALGVGMEFRDGDLAWRCNFATVAPWPHIADRRAGRDLSAAEAAALAEEVNRRVELPGASFEFRATVGHRAVLRMRDDHRPLSAEVQNTDPAYQRRGPLGVALESFEPVVAEAVPVVESDAGAARAAELTNLFTRRAHEVLEASSINSRRRSQGRLPANVVLSRDAGDHLTALPPMNERFGCGFGCFVEMPVEAGIARLTGMLPVPVPQEFGSLDEQYRHWAKRAAEAAAVHDALYIHIKGPDVPAHDGRWEEKVGVIEAIDRSFFGELALERSASVLLVTADHGTSCVRKAHIADPVPYLIWGPQEADGSSAFTEEEARRGALPHRYGVELMPHLVTLMSVEPGGG
ncbi:MAG: alkaline phosphatase family protein [Actinomycetota bacterium]|nr:alkaline phosphatase family protein [Actinomycetota bacterium]